MAFAANYRRWILQRLKPFLGKHIVEVGAGIGSLSELLLDLNPESLTLLEPSANVYPLLVQKISSIDKGGLATTHQGGLADVFANNESSLARPDSAVYVNVLEHIEDDQAELRLAHSVLAPGGHVLIFVPANRWLMGSVDRLLGHFRRYTLDELTEKCVAAGFTVRFAAHFDFFGIAPWWLKYCVLQSERVEPTAVWLYDRWVVPFAQKLEKAIAPPIGKNLIVVGEKPA
jgi:SAM-dependent methyltransferase